jgi:SH3-like domain-containing protein
MRHVMLTLIMLALPLSAAFAAATGAVTGLPVPRYAALKSNQVNMRTGPGKRYPIEWVVVRENMPVQIVAEYENWRKVKDFEGVEGWVHRAMLSSRRSVMVVQDGFIMRRESTYNSPAVAKLMPTIAAELETCQDGWCKVRVVDAKAGEQQGWVQHEYLWGVGLDEVF